MLGNMKAQKVIYLSALLLMFGCSSLKKSMITTSENLQETAIQNAILDFSTDCNLFKKASVFRVSFSDSVFNVAILERVDEKSYKDGTTHEWKRGSLYDGIVSVEISVNVDYQYYYSEETKAKLPSRYIIKNDKLFYWWDDNYPVTEEMIAVLWRYNLLQTDLIIPEFTIDDSLKGADYYFCKSDLSEYKRVITNIGLGYYKPPKLKCK
jgi:hypothetical protein